MYLVELELRRFWLDGYPWKPKHVVAFGAMGTDSVEGEERSARIWLGSTPTFKILWRNCSELKSLRKEDQS